MKYTSLTRSWYARRGNRGGVRTARGRAGNAERDRKSTRQKRLQRAMEYGPTVAYGQTAPCSTTPSGSQPIAVSARSDKPHPRHAEYHYLRVVATGLEQSRTWGRSDLRGTHPLPRCRKSP